MSRTELMAALDHVETHLGDTLARLAELVRIPSVSAEGFPAAEVRRSAEATAALLRGVGLENVRLIESPGPSVRLRGLAARGGRADAARVRPPRRAAARAARALGHAGLRARPSATAGSTAAAPSTTRAPSSPTWRRVRAWLETAGRLPLNVKLLVEGEEEIGSPGLEAFLKRHGRSSSPPTWPCWPTPATSTSGHPALTYQLRGICQVDVEVRCLKQPVHSGFWGGPMPDAVRILARLVAGLEKKDGSLDVPGLYRDVAKTGPRQLRRIRSLPFDEAKFRASAAMKPGTRFVGERAYSVWERLWTRPALTVIALEAHPIAGSSNQILDAARARLSLRTVPDMDEREGRRAPRAEAHHEAAGRGARDGPRDAATSRWWTTDPEGPAFEAARRALRQGYGREAAMIGAGGSIGFVKPFSEALGGVPCLLMGVEDPPRPSTPRTRACTSATSARRIRAAVHLYDELSQALAPRRRRPTAARAARRR